MSNIINKLLVGTSTAALLLVQAISADISHSGTVSMVRTHAGTADASLSESWTFVQVAGLTSTSSCAGDDDGVGDLAYLALPASERFMESLFVSAYLSGKNVEVLVDDANLLEGNCRVKHVSLIPFSEAQEVVPAILAFDHPNLVAAYTMDNINGFTVVDEGGAYDGTSNGATTTIGVAGNSLSFDADDYVSTPITLPSSGDWTVSAWLRTSELGTAWFSNNNGQSNRMGFLVAADGAVRLFLAGTTNIGLSSVSALSGVTYHHVLFSRQGSTFKIYFDGVEESSAASSNTIDGATFHLGHNPRGDQQFLGEIDLFRVFNKSLTPSEIVELYNEVSQ